MFKNRRACILVLRFLSLLKGTTTDANPTTDPQEIEPAAICMVVEEETFLAAIPC